MLHATRIHAVCLSRAFIFVQLHFAHHGRLGALLVYDITDSESFVKVKNWVKELRKMVRIHSLQSSTASGAFSRVAAGWQRHCYCDRRQQE